MAAVHGTLHPEVEMVAAWLAATLCFGAPSATEMRDAYEAHRDVLNERAKYPIRFSTQEWAKLADGNLVKRRERLDGTDRVLGAIYVDAGFNEVWVSIQDDHATMVDGFVSEDLPGSSFHHRILFQSIQLPWPMAPRQWVIEVISNHALQTHTNNTIWERHWKLSHHRGAKSELPKGVWLPANDGAWTVVDVGGGGTVVVYNVRTAVGGMVPDEAAVRWSWSTLTSLLKGVRDRTGGWVQEHYVNPHPPIERLDKVMIPVFTP